MMLITFFSAEMHLNNTAPNVATGQPETKIKEINVSGQQFA